MLRLERAWQIVRELAEQNLIDPKDCPEAVDYRPEQEEAIERVWTLVMDYLDANPEECEPLPPSDGPPYDAATRTGMYDLDDGGC